MALGIAQTFCPKSFQLDKKRRLAALGDAGATRDEPRRERSAGPAGMSQPPSKKLRLTPQVGASKNIPGRRNGCTPVSSASTSSAPPRAPSSSISAGDRMEEEEDVQEEDENGDESGMWDEYGYLSAVTVSPKPSRFPSPMRVDMPAIRQREKETRSTSAAEKSQEQANASASVNAQVQRVTMPKVPVVSPDRPSGQPDGGHSSEHTTRAAGGNQWPMLDAAAAPSQQQTTGRRVKYIMREFSRELSYDDDDDDDDYEEEEEGGEDDDDDDDEGDSFPSPARSKTPPFQRSSGPSPDSTPRRAGVPNHHTSAPQTEKEAWASHRAQMASSTVLPAVRTTRRLAVSAALTAPTPSAAPASSMLASSAPKPLQSTGSQAREKPPASAPGPSQGDGSSQSLKSAYPSRSVNPSRTKTVNTTSTPNPAPVPNVSSLPPAPPTSIHTRV